MPQAGTARTARTPAPCAPVPRAGTTRAPLLVCAPLLFEARAVRRGLRDSARAGGGASGAGADPPTVMRTGYGPARAARHAEEKVRQGPFDMLAITGTGAGLAPDLTPGDLVVATEVTSVGDAGPGDGPALRSPSAPLLVGELRRAGLRARAGRVATVDHLVRRAERDRLAREGMAAADMESAQLAAAAGGRPLAVIRAISDTADRPLLHPGVLAGGLSALRSLRAGRPGAGPLGRRVRRAAGAAGRAAVVLRRGRARHRDRRARPGPARLAGLRAQADRAQRPRGRTTWSSAGPSSWTSSTRCPTVRRWCSPRTASRPRCGRRRRRRELSVVDATCPLVAKVHKEALRFAADGYLVALIGHNGHEEVEGTLGEAPGSTVLVETPEDVAALRPTGRGQGRLPHADDPGRGRGRGEWPVPCWTGSPPPAGRAATTSATPRPTASRRCAWSRRRPIWCSWPGRRTHRIPGGWWKPPRGREPPLT